MRSFDDKLKLIQKTTLLSRWEFDRVDCRVKNILIKASCIELASNRVTPLFLSVSASFCLSSQKSPMHDTSSTSYLLL